MGEGWVGQGTVITCQARWAEKAGETRVIFIVRGWWGDKQRTPSTGGRRDALHFRYDDDSKHPATLQLFIVTYLWTSGRLWPIRETWNRTPRGVWLKKEATEWNLGGAEDWESGWEKRVGRKGTGRPSIFPSPTRSTLIDQSKRMKYWQWPIGNYLYNARNEQFTRENWFVILHNVYRAK